MPKLDDLWEKENQPLIHNHSGVNGTAAYKKLESDTFHVSDRFNEDTVLVNRPTMADLARARDIYRLSLDGRIDIEDPSWGDELQQTIIKGDIASTEALLCCGVPVRRELIDFIPPERLDLKKLCNRFSPDMWTAVKMGNVKQVRCLVNLWHKVDIRRESKTLFQLAIESSNPYIIALIGGIQTTMHVAHCVLAGDLEKLRSQRTSGSFIKRTLKHFGHNCAPILYFAMIEKNTEMIEELCSHFGMRADEVIITDQGDEMPLLFVALNMEMEVKTFRLLASFTNKPLHSLWFKSKNVLEYAVEQRTNLEFVKTILEVGGGQLLAERDVYGSTVLDLLKESTFNDADEYIHATEEQMAEWKKEFRENIGWLAVMGWLFEDNDGSLASTEIWRTQELIAELDECIVNDDFHWFEKLGSSIVSPKGWPSLLWFGRPVGCGQTLLHRAVIYQRKPIVEYILSHMDSNPIVLDNFGASALHYAFSFQDNGQLEALLLDAGFGEHFQDKNGNDCISYRMRRSSPEMTIFLDDVRAGKYQDALRHYPCNPLEAADTAPCEASARRTFLEDENWDRCDADQCASSTHNHSHRRSQYGVAPDTWCTIC